MQKYFGSPQANRIATYIAEEFGDAPEFLWASTPDAAIFRNRSSKKWYGVIMSVAREKVDPRTKSSARDAEEFRNMGWQDRFRYHPKMAWATILISTVIVLSIVLMVLL